ncbi:trna delta -isopentenylpyrophosphate transferase [Lasius niger]|uniref:tRNA dimethylallyltransferase n=1 Tax=Lasius niger TaxID=67767 RepID=A0A0J7KVN3_LASNI|nr:trna delta -isopentenylpyrophosphate transferase [Lasius niger]
MMAEDKTSFPRQKALIVAGPTCSGKSALAMRLAEEINGVVINADAMQCYKDLRILTARPSEEDEKRVPHFLYGVLDGAERGSVGWWLPQAMKMLSYCAQENLVPIFCGGTGMYINALIHGIADIPPVSDQAREAAEILWEKEGGEKCLENLKEQDPQTAAKLKPQDQQRICRALSVLMGTEKPLSYWQSRPQKAGGNCDFHFFHFAPEREFLRSRLERRFEKMLAAGAWEEVERFLERGLSSSLPLMRAHGVPELKRYQEGEISLEEAASLAISAMRSYAKRQDTWFRHHALGREEDGIVFKNPISFDPQEDEIDLEKASSLALGFLKERGF